MRRRGATDHLQVGKASGMTSPEPGSEPAADLAPGTDVEAGSAGGAPDERPATSDPDQMVDTPDELGGTGGPDPGGAG